MFWFTVLNFPNRRSLFLFVGFVCLFNVSLFVVDVDFFFHFICAVLLVLLLQRLLRLLCGFYCSWVDFSIVAIFFILYSWSRAFCICVCLPFLRFTYHKVSQVSLIHDVIAHYLFIHMHMCAVAHMHKHISTYLYLYFFLHSLLLGYTGTTHTLYLYCCIQQVLSRHTFMTYAIFII